MSWGQLKSIVVDVVVDVVVVLFNQFSDVQHFKNQIEDKKT